MKSWLIIIMKKKSACQLRTPFTLNTAQFWRERSELSLIRPYRLASTQSDNLNSYIGIAPHVLRATEQNRANFLGSTQEARERNHLRYNSDVKMA